MKLNESCACFFYFHPVWVQLKITEWVKKTFLNI